MLDTSVIPEWAWWIMGVFLISVISYVVYDWWQYKRKWGRMLK